MQSGRWSRPLLLALASLAIPGTVAWSSEIQLLQRPSSQHAAAALPTARLATGSNADIRSLTLIPSEAAVRRSEDDGRDAFLAFECMKARSLHGRSPEHRPATSPRPSCAEGEDALLSAKGPDIFRLCRLLF